jgi:hypothetical protein
MSDGCCDDLLSGLELAARLLVGVHGLVARPTAHRIDHAVGMVRTRCLRAPE